MLVVGDDFLISWFLRTGNKFIFLVIYAFSFHHFRINRSLFTIIYERLLLSTFAYFWLFGSNFMGWHSFSRCLRRKFKFMLTFSIEDKIIIIKLKFIVHVIINLIPIWGKCWKSFFFSPPLPPSVFFRIFFLWWKYEN